MSIRLLASLTCFRETFAERGLAWICAHTAELGLDGLEFWNVRVEMENLDEVTKLMRATGVTSPSYCCVGTNFASADERERRKARDVIRANLVICNRIGASLMRIDLGHPDAPTYTEAKPFLLEAITPCLEDARQANVVLAIHNHGIGWTGESLVIKDLVETIGSPHLRARVCPGNFLLVSKESDPAASGAALLPLAAGIFLKDWRMMDDAEKQGLPSYQVGKHRYVGTSIGKGVIDYARFLASLRSANYAGVLVLNIEKGIEDDLTAIRESVAFVRNAFKGDHYE